MIVEYQGTGEHRISTDDGELICCVGNMAMELERQEALAERIAQALEHDSARTSALHEAAEMHERAYARTMDLNEKAWHQRMAEHLRWMADLEYT